MRGLVFNNEIVDVVQQDFEVHEDAYWIDVPNDCKPGWKVSNDEAIRPNPITEEELLAHLRMTRDNKLRKTDWWVMPDRQPTKEQLAYRQALRDITDKYKSMNDVVWPVEPN
jgi:hypothetical protein